MALAAFTIIGLFNYSKDNASPSIQSKVFVPQWKRGDSAPQVQLGNSETAIADKAQRFVEFAKACFSYQESVRDQPHAQDTGQGISYWPGQNISNSLPLPPGFQMGKSWSCNVQYSQNGLQSTSSVYYYYAVGSFPSGSTFPVAWNKAGSYTVGIIGNGPDASGDVLSVMDGSVIMPVDSQMETSLIGNSQYSGKYGYGRYRHSRRTIAVTET